MHRAGQPADDLLLLPRLEAAGVGVDWAYLDALRSEVPSAANLEYYLPDLQDAFRRRQLLALSTRAAQIARDEAQGADQIADALDQISAAMRQTFGDDELPPIICATALADRREAKPPELVYGLLHKGSKLVLGGGSKSFKTWSLIDLALSVSHGEPWLSLKTAKGKVLYCNFELQDWSFAERVESVAGAKGIHVEPSAIDVWNLRGHSAPYSIVLPKIRERIKDAGYGLVILDPCYKLLGDLDENSAGDIGKLLNSIEDLTVATGAAVAFGAHFSKGNQAGKEAVDRISGSGVFARDPDSILVLTRHEQDGAFTVESILRNFRPIEPFVIRWDYPLFRRDDSLDPAKLKQAKCGRPSTYSAEMLLGVIGNRKLATKEWLKRATEEIGIGRTKFFELLRTLKAEKRIEQNGKEQWVVISPGSPETT